MHYYTYIYLYHSTITQILHIKKTEDDECNFSGQLDIKKWNTDYLVLKSS